MNFATATSTCEGLTLASYSDWRLPNINELLSLVNYDTLPFLINSTYFPNPPAGNTGNLTSSTIDPIQPANRVLISFAPSSILTSSQSFAGNSYVRCVRGGL